MRLSVTAVPTSRSAGPERQAGTEGQSRRVRELSASERAQLGIACNLDDLGNVLDDAHYLAACEDAVYWNEDGQELDPEESMAVTMPPVLDSCGPDGSKVEARVMPARQARA